MIKSIVWASTIDYPDQVSTVLFVGTCNWRCEFCHNLSILDNDSIDFDDVILPKLLNRQDFVNHVVISGGECTCWNNLIPIILKLRENGFVVGIHTNGSNPHVLMDIFPYISFVGMDIKTSGFERYCNITKSHVNMDDISESIRLIVESGIESDFRTTMFPKYVDKNDCINIATVLQTCGAKQYAIQQFDDSHIETDVKPYSKSYLDEIQEECSKIIPTIIRGY